MSGSKGDIVTMTEGRTVTAEEAREERAAAMEARLARLEAFVAQWARIVGAPGAQHAPSAEELIASRQT